ncbi:MAG: sensor domain-containing diguanylate cyclase [Magnetospiraceae bacterium]
MKHRAVRNLRVRYLIGLSAIAFLITASWYSLQHLIAAQENYSKVVTMAGQQRGHSERISFFALTMVHAKLLDDYRIARSQLGRVIHKLEESHRILRYGDADADIPRISNDELNQIYVDPALDLDNGVSRYLFHARKIYNASFGELTGNHASWLFIQQNGPHVIGALFDAATDEYEKIGREAIVRIEEIETAIWLGTFVVLIFEVILIFRPMERRVDRALDELAQKNDDLEKTVVELVSAKANLTASEEKFRAMAVNVPGVIFQMQESQDGDRGFLYVSPRSEEYCGVSSEELEADWTALPLHPEDRERFVSTVRKAFSNQTDWVFEGRMLTQDGDEKWVAGASRPIQADQDNVVFNGVIIDITAQKEMEAELRRMATEDALTSAYNRRQFMDLAEQAIERAWRHRDALSVMMIDLDHFKHVNDTYGHAAGDETLKQTVAEMRRHIRHNDVLGRLGGEEFGILSPQTEADGAANLAERIRLAIADQEIHIDGQTISVTVSIGISRWLPKDAGIDQALARADKALYQAKETGRNRVCMVELPDPEPVEPEAEQAFPSGTVAREA